MIDLPEKPQYPKGDLRRMLAVLGAIDSLGEGASMSNIGLLTGLDRRTVCTQVEIARQQAAVQIVTWTRIKGRIMIFYVEDWGPYIQQSGAKLALDGCKPVQPEKGRAR